MKFRVLLTLMLSFAVGASAADSWSLEYGKDPGKVSVFNSNTDSSFREDQPYGPMSFRIHKRNLWVLDSIGSKIYCFDSANHLRKSLNLTGFPENLILEDFALIPGSNGEPESVWIAEAALCEVRKISLGSGKELVKIGGNGNEAGKFLQINQLETDRTGRLYVGDIGRSVISVFTPYGELVREIPWQRSGFALDNQSRLHLIRYSESAGYFADVFTPKGQLEKSLHIGMPELTNPRLWAIAANGNMVLSFVPAAGFKGSLKLFELSPYGKIVRKLEFSPPGSMNRYLAGSAGQIWLAEADFAAAPAGKFLVKTINWGEM